jgi:oxepin-CoA hydrolase / 3-oxo-5,6-dehydrosuberyl-CoA semialdehyde dehydrogenase
MTSPDILPSYVMGAWQRGAGDGLLVRDATFGRPVARVSSDGLDLAGALAYARETGGPALRRQSFHERAVMLKKLAQYLLSRKEELYELSYLSGTTRRDAWIDIEGGIGTLFSYSSLVRRELPNETFLVEDAAIPLSKNGTFLARHLLTPREGVAVHINAYNFPCWGMLEKLAPTLAAGMPAVVKPAPQTAYLAEALARQMLESSLLPEGAVQLVAGDAVDFFPHLVEQDAVTFTGSAATGKTLKAHPNVIDKAVPFTLEADSLNAAVLSQTAQPGDPEFELFVKEVVREMTVKAGQKCTAIRRVLVPRGLVEAVGEAIGQRLAGTVIGDPRSERVRMGPLVDAAQREEVARRVAALRQGGEVIYQAEDLRLEGGDPEAGAFLSPTLLYCGAPFAAEEPHTVEAFGPVATLMPFDSTEEAVALTKLGRGSLVSTLATHDPEEARAFVLGVASHHGRILVLNRDNAAESTGHGSPLPQLVHGGPGRAGGGEELGGARSVKHFMQRTALQADPTTLMAVTREYVRGATTTEDRVHPFRKTFDELAIGESYTTHRRTVTEADIVNFAGVSGDYFYAHVDEVAAPESIFEKRVAHGYFLISAAAGLFVDPRPGPVLANYGLENLRFVQPVGVGDTIQAKLTVKQKIKKDKRETDKKATGVVAWDVRLVNQHGEDVALYTILTLVERRED